ncbi:MAG TPA: TonB-dependent receptor plug domain-containing protein, partial [Thermoanaerobaculia bacterium]|nr:TonB-dependent receptor plug domain-containing protein [Thermoanaerobaculia bacterium]
MQGTLVTSARLLLWGMLAVLLALPAAAQITPGERPDPSDLKDLSLEDLMEIDVTSVSKRSERLSRAAAAITVITREDLRRSGATSLPEALRLVNSLEIARQDTRNWAISARGFNLTLANKLLVLIDGRSVYTPLFAGVFWDVQDVLLEDVERIEIIRGPGATLWGANAVNGVINIITRSAADTQGGLVSGAAGNEERAIVAGRYGGKIGDRGHYRLYAKSSERDSLALPDGSDPGDPYRLRQGGFRADWKDPGSPDAWTLQGDLYDGVIGELTLQDDQVDGANLL